MGKKLHDYLRGCYYEITFISSLDAVGDSYFVTECHAMLFILVLLVFNLFISKESELAVMEMGIFMEFCG